MRFIATTQSAVSKFRKAAKLRVREGEVQLAQALDEVAREHDYFHWKHVMECMAQTAARGAPLSLTGLLLDTRPDGRIDAPRQDYTLIVGRPGSGKTVRARDFSLNALRNGMNVVVLDWGGSYLPLAKAVGGNVTALCTDGTHEEQLQGDGLLQVIEFGRVRHSLPDLDLGPMRKLSDAAEMAESLLVIDEIHFFTQYVPGVVDFVERHVTAGGSLLVCSQTDPSRGELGEVGELTCLHRLHKVGIILSR